MNRRLRLSPPCPLRVCAAGCLSLAAALTAHAAPPPNDAFAAPAVAAVGVTAGTTVEATHEAGEPSTHLQNTATGKSVWFTFTPPATGLYTAVAVGTDATPVAHNVAVYAGSTLGGLTRVAGTSLFQGTAGQTYRIQVTGATNAGEGAFDLTVTRQREGRVVLPFFSTWDFLHPLAGEDPTADVAWATTWKTPGDTTAYTASSLTFALDQPAPLAYGGIDRPPGQATSIGTPTGTAATNNNAAYFRRTFTLAQPTSNLWAEILADDGAYIYIDDQPGIPVHIAAKLTAGSITTNTGFEDYRPQPDVHATGAIPTAAVAGGPPGCRAYVPGGFSNEVQTQMVFVGGLVGRLEAGTHTIAVSAHQTNTGSSDMGMDLQLVDFDPRPLPAGGVALSFNETPFVNSSTTATVVPAAEHHFAPNAGQTDLAWFCVSPTTRGTTALRQGVVFSDTTTGSQKALMLRGAEAGRFVTEPVSIAGLANYTASIKIRTRDTSSGFEVGDGFRVFLETSANGVDFAEPTAPAELQPYINDDTAFDAFSAGWVTRSVEVTPEAGDVAVRLVIEGGTDSSSEFIYFDDVFIGRCQVFPTVTNVFHLNQNDDDPANDTFSFDLIVEGVGTTAATFTTSGLPGGEATGAFSTATTLTLPVTTVNGVRQPVVFQVQETGNPVCTATVTVTPPAGAVASATFTGVSRSRGASDATAADDTISFTVNVAGNAVSTGWEMRSSDPNATAVLATGLYGQDVAVTVPATTTPVLVFSDKGEPAIVRNAPIDLTGTEIAVGRTVLGGVTRILYAPAPLAAATTAQWLQASIAPALDGEFTPDATTSVLWLGNTANASGTPATATGNLTTETVTLGGAAPTQFTARLRAVETSTGSGFEVEDTFRIELIITRPIGVQAVNLMAGNALDQDGNALLNGFTDSAAAPYDTTPTADEFNAAGELEAGSSRGYFSFSHIIPADATAVQVSLVGTNNSSQEYFFVHEVVLTESTPLTDVDADGLPDQWETQYFGNLAQTGTGDPDGDGQPNAAEYAAGTRPNDATDRLAIVTATRDATNVTLTWSSVAGKTYRVERSLTMAAGSWSPVGLSVTASGPQTTAARPHDGSGAHFYRVVTP